MLISKKSVFSSLGVFITVFLVYFLLDKSDFPERLSEDAPASGGSLISEDPGSSLSEDPGSRLFQGPGSRQLEEPGSTLLEYPFGKLSEDPDGGLSKDLGGKLSDNSSTIGFRTEPSEARIWISMGLCWGQNAQVYGKKEFPYTEAALRSVSLWSRLTKAQPIVQISYSGTISPELLEYRRNLEDKGALVYFNKTNQLPCVLSSQLTRMLAYKLDIVAPTDIIITADVDAFIETPGILEPLNQTKAVWIWQYVYTVESGYTFAMSFIAATSLIWRDILGNPEDLNEMSKQYEFRKNEDASSWDIDQLIVSRGILDSGLCSLPSQHSLWKTLDLSPDSERKYEESCWKGSRIWDNCNKNRHLSVCYWWHFHPDERIEELESKYREILQASSMHK